MKIHTPLFIIGLLTFVTPFLGLPSYTETIIIAVYGIAIMLIVSTIKLVDSKESGRESIIEEVRSESISVEQFNDDEKEEDSQE